MASSDTKVRSVLAWTLAHDDRFLVVAEVPDGDSVLSFAGTFEVAIVDLAIHGLGVLGVLRQLSRRERVPVVVVVSHTDAIYIRHALVDEGAADYVSMPDELDELPDRLIHACSGAAAMVAK